MASSALTVVTLGGLALVFLMYFGKGFCDTSQPQGGAFCFRGFRNLITDFKSGIDASGATDGGTAPIPIGVVQSRFKGAPAPRGRAAAPAPKGQLRSRFGGGGCNFVSPTQVCWQGANGTSSCTQFNAKSSDASSVSGRQTLCQRVQAKYLAQHRGSQSLSYVGQRIGVA